MTIDVDYTDREYEDWGPSFPEDDVAVEERVLGTMLVWPEKAIEYFLHLGPEAFLSGQNQMAYDAMCDLYRAGKPVDPHTLVFRLKEKGQRDCFDTKFTQDLGCVYFDPTPKALKHYAWMLETRAIRRKLAFAVAQMNGEAQRGESDPIADITRFQQQLKLLQEGASPRDEGRHTLTCLVQNAHVTAVTRKPGEIPGVMTGLRGLDAALGGFLPKQLTILAARPGIGKSALAMQIAMAAARAGKRVLFISLEMSAEDLGTRVLYSEASIDLQRGKQGTLDARAHQALARAAEKVTHDHVIVRVKPRQTIDDIRNAIRDEVSHKGPDVALVVVDYLQLIVATMKKNETREQVVAEMSRQLKLMAQEFSVAMLVLAQLNRASEARPNKRPLLSDLRESGAIEQDADTVLLLFREDPGEGVTEVIVAKQRAGATGLVKLYFDAKTVSYRDL